MNTAKPLRVMWLLNHTTARKFEISMLNAIGIEEIFLPKIYPQDHSFRTASIDWTEDQKLSIPKNDLDVLNQTNWYEGVSVDVWKIANKYFDVAFFLPMNKGGLDSVSKYFSGMVIWRVYGRDKSANYDLVLNDFIAGGGYGGACVRRMGRRFYFGEAYSHLSDIEPHYLRSRRLFLPLGMRSADVKDQWEGSNAVIYFVCPEIASSPIYGKIYQEFKCNFHDFPYIVAGAQPIAVNDTNVLGYVTDEQHAYNMVQSRVMFYHSQEPNHIHYHPFEAIRAGMPLVFMAGGMLDRMGGMALPGRCETLAEARRKIKRILADDRSLIERIRMSQVVLLEPMKPENCELAWREGFERIASDLEVWRHEQAVRPKITRRKRVAVILPVAYRGESLRGALALAKALYLGSRQWGEDADVVFVHLDDPATYPDDVFVDLQDNIARRAFNWRILSAAESRRAMRYAGFQGWEPSHDNYMVPDDGMQQLLDCDLWLIVSDRLSFPVLPMKPVVLMIYDYLQRYEDLLSHGTDMPFLNAARHASRVLVTTKFTQKDAIQYAGVDPNNVCKVPMLAPEFPIHEAGVANDTGAPSFFLWTINAAPHKNHMRAAEALQIYYEELDGELDCRVTGVNSKGMLASDLPHLKAMATAFQRSKPLRKHVKWMGELPDIQYRRLLSRASFLWHAGRIDNGTFSVIEAACLGVPSLSSDYPAMREIDEQFSLNLAWMNPDSLREMAEQLKRMEEEATARRKYLPSKADLEAQRIERHAKAYWQEVRSCL